MANSEALPVLHAGFANQSIFQARMGNAYALLPLRFLALDAHRYIATNFAGEYIVLASTELHALIKHTLDPCSLVYDELKSKHFLIDDDSKVALDLLATKYRTKHSRLKELTSLFMFVVTLRCEHSCPYCQVSRRSHDKTAFDMSERHAKDAIDMVFQSPSSHIKIEFQGGEPLLNFNLIRWIVERVSTLNQQYGKDIAFVIATNLALIQDDMLMFCAEHGIAISTSLDGPRELHNHNRLRPGHDSYERVIQGIAAARAALGADHVSALMTTTKESLHQPEAIIDEYVNQGFTSIFLRGLSPYGFAVKTGVISGYDIEQWLQFYKRGLNHILALNEQGVRFREDYTTLLLRKMLTPFPTGYVDLQSPAGMALSCLAFNYDGAIYASDEARMLAEMNDTTFRLGHVSTDSLASILSSETLLELLASSMTEAMPMCSDCGIQPYCGSDPVFHHTTQHDPIGLKPASSFCTKSMAIIRHLISLLEDHPTRGAILRSWIH